MRSMHVPLLVPSNTSWSEMDRGSRMNSFDGDESLQKNAVPNHEIAILDKQLLCLLDIS